MNVGLAELEILHIQFLHCAYPKKVERRKEPASATALLVRYRPLIQPRAERIIHLLHLVTA